MKKLVGGLVVALVVAGFAVIAPALFLSLLGWSVICLIFFAVLNLTNPPDSFY